MKNYFTADLVLCNGNIITVDDRNPRAQAVAVWNSQIVWVGDDEDAHRFVGEKTNVIDLKGRTLLPGFNEAHNHMIAFGLPFSKIELNRPDIGKIDDLKKALKEKADSTPSGEWLIGIGYDEKRLAEGRPPHCRELDEISRDHPIVLINTSYHTYAVNSNALALAGITRTTQDPPGGRILRSGEGEPIGIFEERAVDLIRAVMPSSNKSDLRKAIRSACDKYIREGITSSQDAWLGIISPLELAAYQEAMESGELSVRVNLMVDVRNLPEDLSLFSGLRGAFGNDRLKIGPIKIFADGSLTSRTAALRKPYADDPGNHGTLVTEPAQLKQLIRRGHEAGWQIAVHADGDRGVEVVFDAFEEALSAHPVKHHRHRVEHCGVLGKDLMQRLKELDLIVVTQPRFIGELGDGYIAALGRERIRYAYPLKSLVENGIRFAFGSDRPIVDGAPLLGIHDAVNQRTNSGREYCPDEAIAPEDAIRAYTLGGAYASCEETIKGSIETGKLADFTILSEDPTEVPRHTIKDIRVLATIVGGKILYNDL